MQISKVDPMISLVVLAAGRSSRFGKNKLLHEIGGRTVIGRVVESALGSEADEVILVLGHDAGRVRRALTWARCRFVYNRVFREGQSSSVKAGLSAAAGHSDAVMILPGDIALISSEAINKVIGEYRRTGGPIVVAAHQGKLGHPILFDKVLFGEVAEIDENSQGLKAVVRRHSGEVKLVEVGSPVVLFDLDTIEDARRLSAFSAF
jgi:molybdenum cofactor cytidylyltransferase